MAYLKKIVLNCPEGYEPRLKALVEQFIREGVIFVGVVGKDCDKVEEIIDELVVGEGERDYSLLTSNHPNATIDEAVDFAKSLKGEFEGDVEVVQL